MTGTKIYLCAKLGCVGGQEKGLCIILRHSLYPVFEALLTPSCQPSSDWLPRVNQKVSVAGWWVLLPKTQHLEQLGARYCGSGSTCIFAHVII